MNLLRSILGLSPRGTASEAPLPTGAARAENRYYDRIQSGFRIKISWQDDRGKHRWARARVMDMNGTGALVKCSASLPPGSFVYIQTPGLGLMGGAYVRRCEPLLLSYRVGLQFAAPLMTRF
jgi:hypothetical protein